MTLNHILLAFTCLSLLQPRAEAQKPAYALFTGEGKTISYEEILKKAADADLLFLGELHDQAICHWLQLELVRDLYERNKGKITVGAEMFESDNQVLMDEYFNDLITRKKFEEEARLWKNYQTDYKAILEFAREKQLRFIATNAPGRYVNALYLKGPELLDKLSPEARAFLPPYPIHFDLTVPCYAKMMDMGGGHGSGENIARAQALRDASMAYRISRFRQDGFLFVHLNGAYHSDYREGILYYLERYKPGLRSVVLTTVVQDDLDKLSEENKNKGDIILCLPSTMIKSF